MNGLPKPPKSWGNQEPTELKPAQSGLGTEARVTAFLKASSRLLHPGTPLKPFPALCLLLLVVMGRSGIGSAVALMTDRG